MIFGRQRPLSSQRKRALLLALGVVVAGVSLMAQLSQTAVVRGFKWPELFEMPKTGGSQTNRLKGLFVGAQGHTVSNELVRFTEVRIEHYALDGRTNMIAIAPEAYFDRDQRIAWSTGRLEIVAMGGAMRVAGNEGFQVRMTNSTLTISNRVRTVIRQDVVNRAKP